MSTSQPEPKIEKPSDTAARGSHTTVEVPRNDNPISPKTWQAAILSRIWRSRHRDKIVLGALCLIPLTIIWSVLTSDIKDTSLLGRLIVFIPDSARPELAARNENKPTHFEVVERSDFVDLDMFRAVPSGLQNYNVSPTLRNSRLRIKKLSPDFTAFFNHSKTTGSTKDLVCLSGQSFDVRQVESEKVLGVQYLREYELEIDVAHYETGETFDLRWQTVDWNKFQGEDDRWTSVVAGYNIERLVLIVDFPKSAGISMDDIVVKYRQKLSTSFTTLKIEEQVIEIDAPTGEVTWRIGKAAMGTEYALFWHKSLANARLE